MPYVALYRDPSGAVETNLDSAAIRRVLDSGEGTLWVHITNLDPTDTPLLEETFHFHPLAIRDCLDSTYERPKVDDYVEYLFLMLHGVDHEATSHLVVTNELDIFLGPNYVVSSSLGRQPAIDQLYQTSLERPRLVEGSACRIFHHVVDALVDEMLPSVDRMAEVTDEIEDRAIEDPRPEVMDAIMRLKRSALRVHRVVAPQRDIIQRLTRAEFPQLEDDVIPYLRDVYDQLIRIEDLVLMLRERADNALTTYLSAVSIRQNETMRVLSIVAAIFLPLALVTGIYGMNFQNMPELGWHYGYFAVLIGMATYASVIVYWFWARRWLQLRRGVGRALSFAVDPPLLREATSEALRLSEWVLDRTRVPLGRTETNGSNATPDQSEEQPSREPADRSATH
jgi:magnesium transporter